jgi:hypothetical protein
VGWLLTLSPRFASLRLNTTMLRLYLHYRLRTLLLLLVVLVLAFCCLLAGQNRCYWQMCAHLGLQQPGGWFLKLLELP